MDLDVQHDPQSRKFHAVVDGHEAKIEYVETGSGANRVLDLKHTFVDPALRGRGVAQALVARTLEMARQDLIAEYDSLSDAANAARIRAEVASAAPAGRR